MEERPTCPLCGASPTATKLQLDYDSERVLDFLREFYYRRVDETYLRDEAFVIEYCAACEFYWHRYVLGPDGMAELYEHWISPWVSWTKDDTWEKRAWHVQAASRLQAHFDRRPSTVSVLDYGMGWGSFLDAASAFGCDVHGYELSTLRTRHARENGITVHESWDELRTQEFDMIYSNQVVEHVPNPAETLDLLADLLTPGGFCHIAVPRAGPTPTVENVLTKGPYQPLTHINGFPPDTLIEAMEDRGLETTEIYRTVLPPDLWQCVRYFLKVGLDRVGLKPLHKQTSAFEFVNPT